MIPSNLFIETPPILSDIYRPTKVRMEKPATALIISWNASTSCAQLEDDSLHCWGRNDVGQLGTGATSQSCATSAGLQTPCSSLPLPVTLRPDEYFDRYVIGSEDKYGYRHGCALSTVGSLYCWGFGKYGQLGVELRSLDTCGPDIQCALTPKRFYSGNQVIDVALGRESTCIITSEGEVRCFGWGYRSEDDTSADPNAVNCSVISEGCTVEASWSGGLDRLVLTHSSRLCALTQEGQIHCLQRFNPATGNLEAVPIKVKQ